MTDLLNRVTRYTTDSSSLALTGIKRPSSSVDNLTIGYDASNRVASISNGSATWNYAWSLAGSTLTGTITDPLSHTRTITADVSKQVILTDKDGLNQTTTSSYDTAGRVQQVTAPEGNSVNYVYDARGNVTTKTLVSKTPGTPANIVTSASYDATCANIKTCNQPNTTTEALGSATNYAYDATTGLVTSVTSPSASTGAVRPQTRYNYTPLYAYYKNSAGSIVAAATPVTVLTGVSRCATTASCANGADEIKSTVGYGPQVAGTANNLLPVSITTGAGNGSPSSTTAVAYDMVGSRIGVDGPLAGTADTTSFSYDAARQLTAAVGPDPDSAGPLKNGAAQFTYNLDGQPTTSTLGTSNADGSAFVAIQQGVAAYDALGRKVSDAAVSGGVTAALTQYSYDAADRLDCSAQRMNSAVFGSLPASACTLGTAGSAGPDRISHNVYDAADQLLKAQTAYGTSVQQDYAIVTYSPNGKQTSLTDANGNRASMTYDGFDRLSQWNFPSPTAAGVTNTGDYEAYSYDANSNLLTQRKRDGRVLTFAYDALNRLTSKIVPDGCAPIQVGACPATSATRDVYYGYDLLNRQTAARFDGVAGADGIANAFDGLNNLTSTTLSMAGINRTISYQYDAAGNRTFVTHPDGVSFRTDYDMLSRATNQSWLIGASVTPFMGISYDSAGRRSTITRGSSYTDSGYDGISRMTSLTQGFAGSIGNVSQTLSYNPASQIVGQTRDNNSFAFPGLLNVNRPYTANGLNQYKTAGTASFTHDASGSLTTDGTNSFGYDAENRLISANSTKLTYDPLGRLWQIAGPQVATTQWLYDGDQLALEYDGANHMTNRYAWGPGVDEPVMQDTGAALNCTGTRFLHADNQGSIVAQADCSGNRTAVNTYDDYGIPGLGNKGRFQYTGQAWLKEIGLYYYKARMYSPTLGRFMQTDPIGYQDQVHLYAYVGNDPVNARDPSGMGTPPPDPGDLGEVTVTATIRHPKLKPPMDPGGPQVERTGGVGRGSTVTRQSSDCGRAGCQTKPLPDCMRAFLGRYYPKANVNAVRLHNGSPFGLTGNSVTFGHTINLASSAAFYNPVGYQQHIFHEYTHTRQYEAGSTVGDFIGGYFNSGSHDGSPLEAQAIANAAILSDAFQSSPEARQCGKL